MQTANVYSLVVRHVQWSCLNNALNISGINIPKTMMATRVVARISPITGEWLDTGWSTVATYKNVPPWIISRVR